MTEVLLWKIKHKSRFENMHKTIAKSANNCAERNLALKSQRKNKSSNKGLGRVKIKGNLTTDDEDLTLNSCGEDRLNLFCAISIGKVSDFSGVN